MLQFVGNDAWGYHQTASMGGGSSVRKHAAVGDASRRRNAPSETARATQSSVLDVIGDPDRLPSLRISVHVQSGTMTQPQTVYRQVMTSECMRR